MLAENSAFGRKAVTDKYGRKVKHEIKEDLGKFYDIADGEEESGPAGEEIAAGKKKGVKASKASGRVCPARHAGARLRAPRNVQAAGGGGRPKRRAVPPRRRAAVPPRPISLRELMLGPLAGGGQGQRAASQVSPRQNRKGCGKGGQGETRCKARQKGRSKGEQGRRWCVRQRR